MILIFKNKLDFCSFFIQLHFLKKCCQLPHFSFSICWEGLEIRELPFPSLEGVFSSLIFPFPQGHNHKKRMFSENKENVKRLKTSEQINENFCVALEKQTALLEQVKYWGLNICFRNFYFWLVKYGKSCPG